ncbi:hypothetical protein [Anaerosporobacter faecicola]|uniref:hypothetical protein n=1 Tax=Anaerosporobacter faecicola TaxID=2718714 RepID=UPI00143C2839|nr:hypothetical protein [Anaerosporobacter faecicola]
MRQYETDRKRLKYLRKTIYKVHPRWKSSRFARFMLLAACISCTIFSIYWINKMTNTELTRENYYGYEQVGDTFIVAGGCCFLLFLAYVISTYVRKGRCLGALQLKIDEVLLLTDTELQNVYGMRNTSSRMKTEISFEYNDITRIIWNECQQRFEVYGISVKTQYVDYISGKVDHQSKNTGNLEEPYHIYWVYPVEYLEEFKSEIVKATDLQIEWKTIASE